MKYKFQWRPPHFYNKDSSLVSTCEGIVGPFEVGTDSDNVTILLRCGSFMLLCCPSFISTTYRIVSFKITNYSIANTRSLFIWFSNTSITFLLQFFFVFTICLISNHACKTHLNGNRVYMLFFVGLASREGLHGHLRIHCKET